jgi:hypothetical protein
MLVFAVGVALLVGAGCGSPRGSSPPPQILPNLDKVVVMGFRPAIPEYGRPDVVRSPVTGTVFMAAAVSEETARSLTRTLVDRLMSEGQYQIVPPGQARGVYSTLIDSDAGVDIGAVEAFKEVGKAFEADGVMAGYLYRWQEREGGDYAVNRPASVAFDLYIIRPNDGAVLWKAKFDKTQRSLSEDVLDLSTFVESKGRWVKVERLAMIGLEQMLARAPKSSVQPVGGSPEQTEK